MLPSFLASVPSTPAQAAACCGAGGAFPTLITGDDWGQLSLSSSAGSVVGGPRSDEDSRQSLELAGAVLLGDRWQLGASLPMVRQFRRFADISASAVGLGDLRGSVAYEILPEWDYSIWRPKGYVFAQLLVPTGGSVYESTEMLSVDARGRGFYSLAAGLALVKTAANWDWGFQAEVHRPFHRTYVDSSGDFSFTMKPGWGASSSLLGGWSPGGGDFRIGLKLGPVYESPMEMQVGDLDERLEASAVQWSWEGAVQLSYLVARVWSMSAVYSDQSWFGPPSTQTALNRSVALVIQRRWGR